jgi:hypothetical protein
MSACPGITDVLVAYDDGELDAARAQEVRDHLAACPACSRELDGLRGAMNLVGEYLASPPEEEPRAAPAGNPSSRRTSRRAWLTLLAAAAGLALVAGAGLSMILNPGRADARELTCQALEKLESCQDARYRLSFVLPGGEVVERGEVLLGAGGRVLVRYKYAGIEYFFGGDGETGWMGVKCYPGDAGVFAVRAGGADDEPGMLQRRVPDLHEWIRRFKDEKTQLAILLKEKIGDRVCTAVRASNEELGLKMSVTFWIDDRERWMRRVELNLPGMARVRVELESVNAEIPEQAYGYRHYAGEGSRLIPAGELQRMFGAGARPAPAGAKNKSINDKEEF